MDIQLQRQFEEKAFGKPVYIPKFFMHAMIDGAASARHGIKVYREELYIKIRTKGRKDNTVRRATQEDVDVFSMAYGKFLESQKNTEFSLDSLPGYTEALGYTFRDLGVTTVSELLAFRGPYPLAGMKRLWHIAKYITTGLSNYAPPAFKDDPPKEAHNGRTEAQRAALLYAQRSPDERGLDERLPVGEQASNGSGMQGVQRFGVNFDTESHQPEYQVNGQTFVA